jgi:hypothetical protein
MTTLTQNNLTEHFYLTEVTDSIIAERNNIDNSLPADLMTTAYKTAVGMEKVRACLGNKAISVSSWYRCLQLNRILRSKDTSQHRKAEAVDFICPAYGTPADIVKKLAENKDLIRFDQLILEHTWVHISWNSNPSGVQKGEVLSLLSNGGYAIGITDKFGVTLA